MRHFLYLLLFIALSSCADKECHNDNAIFDKNIPGSKSYNDELIRQIALKDKGDITYRFLKYEVREGKEFLHVQVQADDLCAIALMEVTNWSKIEGIKRTKGEGYSNAELDNLRFDVFVNANKTELRFNSVDNVID